MQHHLAEQGGEQCIIRRARARGIEAHLRKHIPGAHCAVVFVHLGGIAVGAVAESPAHKRLGEFGIAAVEMHHPLVGEQRQHYLGGLLGPAEQVEHKRSVDVGLVALIEQTAAEELLQLPGEGLLPCPLLHLVSIDWHRPAILPAGPLVEAIAFHQGIGVVYVHKFTLPGLLKESLSLLCIFGRRLGVAGIGGYAAHCPQVVDRLHSLVGRVAQQAVTGTGSAAGICLCLHIFKCGGHIEITYALYAGVQQGDLAVLCAHGGNRLGHSGPVELARLVKLHE